MYGNGYFETILDNTCSRLHDKQVEYSLKRLAELEKILIDLERELDVFVMDSVNEVQNTCGHSLS